MLFWATINDSQISEGPHFDRMWRYPGEYLIFHPDNTEEFCYMYFLPSWDLQGPLTQRKDEWVDFLRKVNEAFVIKGNQKSLTM